MAHPVTISATTPDLEIDRINLSHLLQRLERNFHEPDAQRSPLQSVYHRRRVEANLSYAQTLITQLEKAFAKIKAPDLRHERLTALSRDRKRVDVLRGQLEGIIDEDEVEDDRVDEDIEDLLGEEEEVHEDEVKKEEEKIPPPEQPQDRDVVHTPNTVLDQNLRRRGPIQPPIEPTGLSSSSSMIPPQSTTTTTTTTTTKLDTEQQLSSHRSEQESLTTSLLSLAQQLKSSTETFRTALESEKSILDRAVEGLDRNVAGLDAAGKRMGALRRMTEGRGWWGRMMMYAWIFALWIVAILLVFVGPKIRF